MHSAETKLRTYANTLPYSILGRDQVGEAFADQGEASKRSDVYNGDLEENIDKDLRRNR